MNDQAANLTSMQQSGCEEQQHMDVVPWNSQLTGNVLSSLQQEHKTTEDTKQQFPSHEEHEIFEGELQLQKNEGKDEANDKAEEQQRPKINCPEKIVLCIDLSSELNVMWQTKKDRSVFEQLKKSVEIFVKHKLGLNKKHQFAFVTFEKEALWVQDFSSDINFINDTLDNIHANPTDPFPQFDLMSLLETIENHVRLPRSSNIPDQLVPEYAVRVILIYGRSHSDIPTLSEEAKRIFDQLVSHRLFFFDVLYVHEIPGEDNKCESIYDALCTLDETEECFVLEVSTYITARLNESMAKLLAHPLQRPKQQDIDYRIVKSHSSDEETEGE